MNIPQGQHAIVSGMHSLKSYHSNDEHTKYYWCTIRISRLCKTNTRRKSLQKKYQFTFASNYNQSIKDISVANLVASHFFFVLFHEVKDLLQHSIHNENLLREPNYGATQIMRCNLIGRQVST